MLLTTPTFWRDRLRASGIHLGLSLVIALAAALLVFGIWYPYPYREISGGRELFLLVVTVDVILGPLITLAVFNRAKPWTELRRDLVIVVLIQLAALAYGLWTVSVARPVHMVFEIDRFRVVHGVDIPNELLERTPPGVQTAWDQPGPHAVLHERGQAVFRDHVETHVVRGQTLLIAWVIDQESQRLMDPTPIVLAGTMKMVHALSPFPYIFPRKIPAFSGFPCRVCDCEGTSEFPWACSLVWGAKTRATGASGR